MAYDSTATRQRLLDAAYTEFAALGFAGARVDRIAADAGANKQAIYAYYGSKEALFDAVIEQRLGILADQVPFTPDDLASYAGALFDHLDAHPQLARLTQWKAVERPAGSAKETESHLDKARQLAESLGISPAPAMDLLMFALAIAQAWHNTSDGIRRAGADPDDRRSIHRAAVVEGVAALVAAATTEKDPR